jgi:hypothetical protein
LKFVRALIPILLVHLSGYAQFSHEVYSDWEGGNAIGVFGRYQIASNALSASMVNAIYSGNDLSRDLRQATSDRLTSSNRMGLDGDFGLYYRHLPDSSKGIGYFVRVADRYHAHGTFSADLLNVAMFGNARFADKSANLGDASATYLQYKQYELGILKTWKKPKATWQFGFGLSLLTGNQSLVADFPEGSLYTDLNGEYLDITLHGSVQTSSIASAQYFDANGWGFSASGHVGMQTEKFGWKFEFDDIGLISWGQHLKRHDFDTIARFEGANLDLFADDPLASVNLDSITQKMITTTDGESYVTVIPGSIRLEGSYALNAKQWKLYAGVHHRFASGYFPLIYLGTSAALPKRFFIDGRFSYGGFGSWNIGLEARKNFAGHFAIRAGTYNLEGFILPDFGTSQSAFIGLIGYF